MDKNSNTVTAVAHSNIALVKYWGKRNPDLNLPATGSVSLTLKELYTRTQIISDSSFDSDILFINDLEADQLKTQRVSKFLDIFRANSQTKFYTEIRSTNSFPTGAGLASSASAFAALTLAASKVWNINLSKSQQSAIARQGSGSAARSVFGGFVEMRSGHNADGSDAFAVQLAPSEHWDLQLLIAITSTDEKKIGSTAGMQQTAQTSPYYAGWVCSTRYDVDEMRTAILNRDFQKVGELAEYSCLKMHALAMSARPALIYWNKTTMQLIHEVYALRQRGLQAYFTIDAGPQVKILCEPDTVEPARKHLAGIPGVQRIIQTSLGPDAYLE